MNNTNFHFANELKIVKNDFKKMANEIINRNFVAMISFLVEVNKWFNEFEDSKWVFDKEWEYELERSYNQKNIKKKQK